MSTEKEVNILKKEIAKLQKEVLELKKTNQDSNNLWHKTVLKIILYGAVASGITSIAHLVVSIISLVKKTS